MIPTKNRNLYFQKYLLSALRCFKTDQNFSEDSFLKLYPFSRLSFKLFWANFGLESPICLFRSARFALTLQPYLSAMKKTQIILLVLVAVAIAVLISFLKVASSYDTFANAKEKPGKFMHVIAKLDKSAPLEYDQLKNPNYLGFLARDTSGTVMKVIYRKGKPDNIEHSERLVLEGKYVDGQFECNNIMMKCPSKYKEDMKAAEKNIQSATEAK